MSINIDQPPRDNRTMREKMGNPNPPIRIGGPVAPLPQRPAPPANGPDQALAAALNHQDALLADILRRMEPGELTALADAAVRLRRECEAAYLSRVSGMPSEPRLKLDWWPC